MTAKRMHVPGFDRVIATVRIGKHCIHHCVSPSALVNGKWEYSIEDRDVILMAVSGMYAMVRRPRCYPYVCRVKELLPKRGLDK